jgi:hypothetical protein
VSGLVLALCFAAQAPCETIAPYYSGYAYWFYLHGYQFYGKSTSRVDYAGGNDRGFIVFDLTRFSDTLTVTAAALEFYQYDVYNTPETRPMRSGIDVFNSTPEGIYTWLTYGSNLADRMTHPGTGWVRHEFHAAGLRATDSCLGYDYFNVAVLPMEGSGSGSAYGHGGGDQAPRLILTFGQSGIAGPSAGETHATRLAPNPARGWVTLDGGSDLALFGPDGRTVLRLVPGRNDLMSIGPGVYFAPGHGKLVVRR